VCVDIYHSCCLYCLSWIIKEVAGCSCEKGGVKKKVFGCLRGKGEKVGKIKWKFLVLRKEKKKKKKRETLRLNYIIKRKFEFR